MTDQASELLADLDRPFNPGGESVARVFVVACYESGKRGEPMPSIPTCLHDIGIAAYGLGSIAK